MSNVTMVFEDEQIEYDIEQIRDRVSNFVLETIMKFLPCDDERVSTFVNQMKVQEYTDYFFRLLNFNYNNKIRFGKHIEIISGKELLNDVSDEINKKIGNEQENNHIIQSDDILLGISITGSINNYDGYYKALDKAIKVNNLINFLNGIDHRPSRVLELNEHVIQENVLYQFKRKKANWSIAQTPGAFESHWTYKSRKNPDNRPILGIDFDKQWLKIIPILIKNEDYLSPLQKQCVRAIDWIGDGIVNSNLTKHFLQIIISLETVIEQNPDESMSKLKKDNIWKVNVSISTEEQIVSIINLIYSLNSKQHVSVMTDKDIKNGYNLRSKIIHEGEKLPENTTELLKNWFDLSYLIIYSLMLSKKWDNVYELWKAANLN